MKEMASKQEWLWERIVQFSETHTKEQTFAHFLDEGVSESTIRRTLKRGTTKRKPGTGRAR
jgi:hypothetical protein